MRNNNAVEVNILYKLARDYYNHTTERSEIQKLDMTEQYWIGVEQMFRNKEKPDTSITAPVRTGKSTVGIAQLYGYVKIGKKVGVLPQDYKIDISNIKRTQAEYDRAARDPKTHHTVLMVDEWATADETGENITTLQAVRQQVADVHAGRYIYTINVSVRDTLDDPSRIILEVVAADREKQKTRCWLYYRMRTEQGTDEKIFLGFVDIDVHPVIKNWIKYKLEDLYYKPNRTEEDNKIIQEWAKKDLYVQYMVRKFDKMEILTKEKVMRERDMDYAECEYAVVEKLRPLAKLTSMTTKEIIKNMLKIESRRLDIPQSIVGTALMADRVYGLLKLWEAFYKSESDLERYKLQGEDSEKYKATFQIRKELVIAINQMQDEYNRLIKVRAKYNATD